MRIVRPLRLHLAFALGAFGAGHSGPAALPRARLVGLVAFGVALLLVRRVG